MKLIPKFDASTITLSKLPSIQFTDRKSLLPDSPGVYFVLGATGEVLYVGRARRMRTRWRGHHAGERMVSQAGTIAWLAVDDRYLLPQMEDACIEYFRPTLNKNPRPPRIPLDPLPPPVLPDWIWELVPKIDRLLGRNPNRKKKKLGLIEALREFQAICVVSQEAGWKLKAYIDGLGDAWLNPPAGTDKNLATLIGEAGEEMATLSRMRHEGKPVHEQREQALAARAALDQFLAALEQQFELKQESTVMPMKRANQR